MYYRWDLYDPEVDRTDLLGPPPLTSLPTLPNPGLALD